ncbi:MAG: caspase family protein, partial [Myxococcales bacterium]|nr:caspase family protein [Myxococcales bacterium]
MTDALDATRFHALLIGINDYRFAPALRGCRNDVARAQAFLRGTVGVPAAQIHTLVGAQVTRQGLLAALRDHLIDNEAIADGDQVLLHFSGHGTEMRDPLDQTASGYRECLVTHDSGEGGEWHVPDRTVGALLHLLAQRTSQITVVFDCCHSGSGTRQMPPLQARLAEPDPRRPPADLDAALLAEAARFGPGAFKGRGLPYTLLAACRDRELAQEHAEGTGDETVHHGLFSWCLYPAIEAAAPGSSYVELMAQVAARVTARDRYQHPQCEGRGQRALFGGADVRRDPFIAVTRAVGDRLTLDAGSLHGLARGARVALYRPEVRTRDALPPKPLAVAAVESVSLTTSLATPEAGAPPVEALTGARGLLLDAGHGPLA